MSDIKVYGEDSKDFAKVSNAIVRKRPPINYKKLAGKILSSDPNTIITVETTKDNYSNIKRGLAKRKLKADVHYKLNFSSKLGVEAFYITVMG